MKHRVRNHLTLLASIAVAAPAVAQAPSLLADLNTQQLASHRPFGPGESALAGGAIYFSAASESDVYGNRQELWVSDGTVTRRLRGPRGETVEASELTPLGSKLLFAGRTPEYGTELWITGATSGSTQLVRDISAGPGSSFPSQLQVLGSRAWFTVENASRDTELWTSDGTSAGTQLVRSLPAGLVYGSGFVAYGGAVYFVLTKDSSSGELWRSDGTSAGTVQVLAAPRAVIRGLTVLGTRLCYRVQGITSDELWASNGTSAGAVRIATQLRGDPVAFRGKLYFAARNAQLGHELGVSDGTAAGTQIWDLNLGAASSVPEELAVVGTRLYFSAVDAAFGKEPWISDGTQTGTRVLADVEPGLAGSDPESFVPLANTVAFLVSTRPFESAVWRTDGTRAGTVEHTPGVRASRLQRIAALGASISFRASTIADPVVGPFLAGRALGSAKRMPGVQKPVGLRSDSSYPRAMLDAGDRVYLSAFDGTRMQVGRSDGTSAGSRLFANIEIDEQEVPGALLGNQVFLIARPASSSGFELVVSDGTTAGTRAIADVPTNTHYYNPLNFFALNGRMFFTATLNNKRGVFSTDGSYAGTRALGSLLGARSNSSLQRLGDFAYWADDGKLWRSNGVTSATSLATLGELAGRGERMVRLDDELVFGGGSGQDGALHFYDGSTLRTIPLVGRRAPRRLTVAGERVFFSDPFGALWVSDGTTSGTQRVRDDCVSGRILAVGSRVFFEGSEARTGRELWVSDGSAAGTRMVVDLHAGVQDSRVTPILSLGDRVLFTTKAGLYGISDGTPAGTRFLRDSNGLALERSIKILAQAETTQSVLFRGQLLLGARDSARGSELFSYFPGASVESVGSSCASPTTRGPSWTCTPPRIGQAWRFDGSFFEQSNPVVAFLSAPTRALRLGNCALHIDPASAFAFYAGVPSTRSWTHSVQVPNDAALIGMTLALQCIQASNASLGFDLTNGLHATLGS